MVACELERIPATRPDDAPSDPPSSVATDDDSTDAAVRLDAARSRDAKADAAPGDDASDLPPLNDASIDAPLDAPPFPSFDAGTAFFTPFGNGRSCATCHLPQRAFSITAEDIEARFQADPNDPLFADVDRDPDGTFTTLRKYALFNVTVSLGPTVVNLTNGARTVVVRRSVPSLENLYFKPAPFLWDGRASTLEAQVQGAARDHFDWNAPVPKAFVDEVVQFERSQFSDPSWASVASTVPPHSVAGNTPLPLVSPTALQESGRSLFFSACAGCHSAPETTLMGAGPAGIGSLRATRVAEANLLGLPPLAFRFNTINQDYITPDPGARESAIGPEFMPSSLRNLSKTAPYFHDNSAPTLDAVIDHYEGVLRATFTAAERSALLAYLEAL